MKLYTEQAAQWLRAHEEETKDLLRQLCRIPAPSHKEEKRAAFCRDWLKKNGAKTVWIDEALNVVCPYGDSEQGPWRIFMAHTDTVFPDTDPMPMREENGILYAPGSGTTRPMWRYCSCWLNIVWKKSRPCRPRSCLCATAVKRG